VQGKLTLQESKIRELIKVYLNSNYSHKQLSLYSVVNALLIFYEHRFPF